MPYRTLKPGDAQAKLVGENLVVMHGGVLPRICLKCGARKKLHSRMPYFEHAPPGLYFSLLLSPVLYVVLALLFRHTGRATISLCKDCDARWRDANTVRTLMAPASLVVAVAIATAVFNGAYVVGVALGVISSALFFWAHARFVRDRTCDVQWIDKRGIALTGVHADAANAAVAPPATALAG